MSDKGFLFKLVKSLYLVVLVLGIIGSGLLFAVGLYALHDQMDNTLFYENIMKYYGIDEINFEPHLLNDTYLSTANADLDSFNKQNFLGTIMVFVGCVSLIFELMALVGAIKENLITTLTILLVMIVGTVSGLFTIQTIDLCTVATQALFILLAAVYVVLLKKNLNEHVRRASLRVDLELNGQDRNAKNRSDKNHIK